jgi:SAM-dependent methyltransferase
MAPTYDDFTAHHNYDGWLAELLDVLASHGLRGRRLLDVGCGTGKSFLPMLPRGWEVTGCDISPAMLALAERKAGSSVALSVADMRELPILGKFDLVWALDDAINYMLSGKELEEALRGMRANLACSGLLLFDVNELLIYRSVFTETTVSERGGWRFTYRGQTPKDVPPGSVFEARLEAERNEGQAVLGGQGEVSEHRQRHFPEAEVLDALHRAGLECLGVYGQGFEGILRQPLDTSIHTKAIYVARRARA